jgi:RNA polymerase sigma-70 factor (ECF subfamily)
MRDDELIQLISNPDTATKGFEMLVVQYREQLYWKIRHLVLDHDDASDVLQNTFIKVWKNIRNFEGKSALSTWLYRIAINESLDFIRRQKNKISTDEIEGSVANRLLADEYFDGDETQAMLQDAIASLPEVQRTVFTLKYYNGMKYSDISKILGTSEGALKASYHLAVKKITEYFKTHD